MKAALRRGAYAIATPLITGIPVSWNHTQFSPPNGNAGAGVNFGRISAALPPRLIQVALQLMW